MDLERKPTKGIRGWSVQQRAGTPLTRPGPDPSLMAFLQSKRNGVLRIAVAGLILWAGGTVVFGNNGVLHLTDLRAEEAQQIAVRDSLVHEREELHYQLQESPALIRERVLREQFKQSKANEIVFHATRVAAPADSAAAADAGEGGEGEGAKTYGVGADGGEAGGEGWGEVGGRVGGGEDGGDDSGDGNEDDGGDDGSRSFGAGNEPGAGLEESDRDSKNR